ncbi:MAG: TolC family protein, partial [Thermoanaerobaculia bacterium]|nr:TolC family protein [Thermoanaerobaculia bacterium]
MTIPDPQKAMLPLAGSLLLVVGGCVSGPRPDLAEGAPPAPPPLDLSTGASPASGGERTTEKRGRSETASRPSGPEEESEPPGPVTVDGDLTLDAALVTALLNNPGLEVARFGPRIAANAVPRELAAFDPRLTGSALYTDATQQLTAVQTFTFGDSGGDGSGDGAPEAPSFPNFLVTENLNLSTTVSTLFPTGTGLSLSGAVDRSDTNFTAEEYEGSWTLRLTQPLLEGRGRKVNLITLRQAENAALRSEWQLRQAVLNLVLQVERTYWELVLAQEVVGIRELGLRLATEQLELNRDLVDTGRAVPSAVLSARAEQASRRADLAEARGRVRTLRVRLLRLLD